ncbi:MAG: multidrug effflux MFS transporter [Francisellaceae bacterium]
MWPYRPLTTVFLLAPVVFSFALALDTYMPAIPEMRQALNTNKEMVQLTLSLFFLITGFGQLILGPISDQFGRYKTLITSAVIFLIGSFLCTQVNSVMLLIVYRIIEAIGACGLFVTAFAVVRDAFSGNKSAMIYSFLNAMISISPILGPIIGVMLIRFFSWHSVFYFLTLLGIITLLLLIFLAKESLPLNRRKPMNLEVFKRYFIITRSLTFWAYTLPATAGVSAFFTLFSMTPYIITTLHESTDKIAIFFGMAGAAFLVGSVIAGSIVHKLGIMKTTLIGTLAIFASAVILLMVFFIDGLSLWGFFAPCMLATFGCALTAGAGASGAMEPFGEFPGAASAVFGSMEMGGSAVIGSIATLFPLNTSMPLGFTMLVMSLLSLLLLLLLSANKKTSLKPA